MLACRAKLNADLNVAFDQPLAGALKAFGKPVQIRMAYGLLETH